MARLPKAPFLYPIVDAGLLADRATGAFVLGLARSGARLIQLRVKEGTDRRFIDLAREALGAAREGGALLIVNDRPDIARIVGADGVHLGQDDLDPRDVRALLGPKVLIGFSTHSKDQIRQAPHDVLDYLAIGPIFETRTKARAEKTVGPSLVREAAALTRLPIVAIGGLSPKNVAEVAAAGASGLALASAFVGSAGPEAAWSALAQSLEGRPRGL